jgi:hypothetical protein
MSVNDLPFKRCTLCSAEWATRDDFLNDADNTLDGYVYLKRRVVSGKPPEGLLLFTHRAQKCGTTLAIAAARFKVHE